MGRLFWCLPICLLVAPNYPSADGGPAGPAPKVAELTDDSTSLPSAAAMERLAQTKPLAFLEKCILRYEREVKGYTCRLNKHERVHGKMQPAELIDVCFRESPFSVLLSWPGDPRPAIKSLFVKGENGDKVLVLPTWGWIPDLDPKGAFAMGKARYPLTEFGIKAGMDSTRAFWTAAQDAKALHVEYLGIATRPELGDRPCYMLKRTRYAKPEADGIGEITLYFDQETWLQVGSILKAKDGEAIAEYFFRDIKLNPDFPKDTFTPKAIGR